MQILWYLDIQRAFTAQLLGVQDVLSNFYIILNILKWTRLLGHTVKGKGVIFLY